MQQHIFDKKRSDTTYTPSPPIIIIGLLHRLYPVNNSGAYAQISGHRKRFLTVLVSPSRTVHICTYSLYKTQQGALLIFRAFQTCTKCKRTSGSIWHKRDFFVEDLRKSNILA
jgi:hypothetical protein